MPPVVIFAGGRGTRLSELTASTPKPLVPIAERPLLAHVMDCFTRFHYADFVVLGGYRWADFEPALQADLRRDRCSGAILTNAGEALRIGRSGPTRRSGPTTVAIHDTGIDTGTGGRLRLARHLSMNPYSTLPQLNPWFVTYGDGLANVDLHALLAFHRAHGKLVTMTITRPRSQYGTVTLDGDMVTAFQEKPLGDWINIGFFVVEPAALEYIPGDPQVAWEREPLQRLAADGQLAAFRHHGFWKSVDTLKDYRELEALAPTAPWLAPIQTVPQDVAPLPRSRAMMLDEPTQGSEPDASSGDRP